MKDVGNGVLSAAGIGWDTVEVKGGILIAIRGEPRRTMELCLGILMAGMAIGGRKSCSLGCCLGDMDEGLRVCIDDAGCALDCYKTG